MSEKTIVIFRKFRKNGDIIAIFPEIPVNQNFANCLSYQKIGQHGAASWPSLQSVTIPANPCEFATLREELQKIGYRLEVKKRCSNRMFKKRVNLIG